MSTHRPSSSIKLPHVLALQVAEPHHGKTQVRNQDTCEVADAALEDELAIALNAHQTTNRRMSGMETPKKMFQTRAMLLSSCLLQGYYSICCCCCC